MSRRPHDPGRPHAMPGPEDPARRAFSATGDGREPVFDEHEAMASFPSEREWLHLELPPDALDAPRSADAFVARTLDAWRDERRLDQDLAALDAALPPAVLGAFAAPPPTADFVDRCAKAIHDERRQRWQQMLARHVAPEPSPQFVSRTLAALAHDAQRGPGAGPGGRGRAAAGGVWWRSPRVWPLLAAAAGIAVWFLVPGFARSDLDRAPLELRLAQRAPLAMARAHTAAALPGVLAVANQHAEPDALVRDAADGVWLLLEGE